MTKRQGLFLAVLIAVSLVIGFSFKMGYVSHAYASVGSRLTNLNAAVEVADVVHSTYVNPVSRYSLLTTYITTGDINKMLEGLGDPYTRYMGPKAWSDLKEETQGSFQGIGVIIGIKDKVITVISPIEGTPGFKAGLKPGDRITRIDDMATKGMTTQQAADLMRGSKGTKVRLELERQADKNLKSVLITRDNIKIRSVKVTTLEDNEDIGYIRISSFSENTSEELHAGLDALKDKPVKGLILDLRYNPGGLLDQAIKVSGEFLQRGKPVLHVVGKGDTKAVYRTNTSDGSWGRYPLVILTNEGTASASEIVTGALQDYRVAVVMGKKTFGKGLIQTVIPLRTGGGITVTTAKYLTAKKRAINTIGIKPDIDVEPGKDTDKQLMKAEEYLHKEFKEKGKLGKTA